MSTAIPPAEDAVVEDQTADRQRTAANGAPVLRAENVTRTPVTSRGGCGLAGAEQTLATVEQEADLMLGSAWPTAGLGVVAFPA